MQKGVLQMLNSSFIMALAVSTIRMATPITIGALGTLFAEQSGTMNLGAEGMMTMGAFFAVLGTYLTGNAWIGVLRGMIAGGLIALLHGFICIEIGGMQNLSGLGLNMFCLGLTAFLLRVIFNTGISPSVESLWSTPFLEKVPFIGKFMAAMSPLVYISFLLIAIIWFILNKTPFGLRIWAAGDDPKTLETAGINVWKIRYLCIVICGVLVGLGGAYLSLGQMDKYVDGMIVGKGMLAFVAVKMGKYKPWSILLMSLVFGFFDALQMQLQLNPAITIAPELIQMIPYVGAITIMALQKNENIFPRAFGEPYVKNKYKF